MAAPNWPSKAVFVGDNLHVMRGMNSESVDLIYLDPPFNSKRNYAAPVGSKAAEAAFKDSWTLDDVDVVEHDVFREKEPGLYAVVASAKESHSTGMFSYLLMMAMRLLELRRLLRSTGSIYLHCDPTASHYLKMVMDAVFGRDKFLNEIIWGYGLGGSSKRLYSKKHDVILFYSKTDRYFFDKPRIRATSQMMKGQMKGCMDTWMDIPSLNNMAKERTGYPTQKPLALLDRIIEASSAPGAVVFDPFCGCATTMVSADSLGREWVGCDLSPKAVELVVERIRDSKGMWADITALKEPPRRTDKGKPLTATPKRDHKKVLYGGQEGYCGGCGTHFMPQYLEMDHIIPRSKGGTDHADNFQLLCGPCNKLKRDRSHSHLVAELASRPVATWLS